MKHYGDITKINGWELPIVDVITGGSPCQDLSVAGKRAGLEGERSGLYMEQIRVIKEMREHDRATGRADGFLRPRYLVWENVPGAFSSQGGEDFRIVLEEAAKVADKDAVVPRLDGKWNNAGAIMGRNWSIAWKVTDAQHWGVPQRRRRVCMLCDFNGHTATDILFDPQLFREAERGKQYKTVADTGSDAKSEISTVSESVSGHSEPGKSERQGIALRTEDGTRGTSSYI